MAYSIFGLLLVPPITFALWNLQCLWRNYRLAQKMNIPIVILPAAGDNPVWILTCKYIIAVLRFIFGEIDMVKYSYPGWGSVVKHRMHEELGDVVVHVTPAYNWLYICEAEAINEVFKRSKDFDRPPNLLAILDVFGPNISTAIGADWQRQRKVTSAPFSDSNNALVWTESVSQAKQMIDYWVSFTKPVRTTDEDTRTLSLHVLSGAGFGKQYSFSSSAEKPKEGHRFNYRDSIALVLENCVLIFILGTKLLAKLAGWPIFGRLSNVGQATIDFKDHMTTMLAEEKVAIAEGKPRAATITNSLIRASEQNGSTKDEGFKGLTEDEIYGNIFVYNFAGHDTTATVFNWAFYLLAAYPEVQDWMFEEIEAVCGNGDLATIEFKDIYSKLPRCLAVMYETLRLWNPLQGICKSTFLEPQQLTIGNQTITIPPDTRIIPNVNAIHSLPRYWGKDSLEWKPSRWTVNLNPEPTKEGHTKPVEGFFAPTRGSYLAWSDGLRPCPGRKFSQVEFVATMVGVFQHHRVEVAPEKGETLFDARERVKRVTEDKMVVILQQMRDPKSVGLRWEAR